MVPSNTNILHDNQSNYLDKKIIGREMETIETLGNHNSHRADYNHETVSIDTGNNQYD